MRDSAETIDQHNAKLPGLRQAQSTGEHNVESQRRAAANALREVTRAQRDLQRREKDIQELQPTLDALDECRLHSERRIEVTEKVVLDVERDLARSRAELFKLERDYGLAKQAAQTAEDEERERGERLNISVDDLEQYHILRAEASTRHASERQQLETLRRQLRAQQAAVQSLSEKAKQLTKAQERVRGECALAEEQKTSREEQIKDASDRMGTAKKNLEKLQQQRTRIGKRETELNDLLQQCYTKLIQAGHDARESEREVKMKESVASLARIFPGVRGRLIDLCKPTQHKYDQAISTVLGRNAEAILVDQEKTAIDCIEYLRNQRIGQATFIPLDTIQAKTINDRLRSVARGARLAIDVIQYDPSIEGAMQYACGSALVCDTLDIARQVSYGKKFEAKTVTLDGTVIHKSGLITGGQSGERVKRWGEREIQGLQKQKQECMDELKSLIQERRDLAPEETLLAQISEGESRLPTLRDDLLAASSRHQDLVTELKNIEKQDREIAPRSAAALAGMKTTEEQVASLEATVNVEDDEVFAGFCQRIGVANIREYEQRQLSLFERQKDVRLEFETHMKRLEHQINFTKSQIQAQEGRLRTNRRVIEREKARVEAVKDENKQVQASIDEVSADIARRARILDEAKERGDQREAELLSAKRELQKASRALDAILKEIANCNDQIEKLAGQRGDIYRRCRLEEINLPLAKGSLSKVPLEDATADGAAPMDIDDENTQGAIAIHDFGIEVNFSDLDSLPKNDSSPGMEAELTERIEKLTAIIDKMAPNMKAADRLGDTEARFRDTESEFEKARREAGAAKAAFNEIKKRRCDLFNKAFNHISGRIDSVYKDLTKGKAAPMGGVAYLSLEDTEEPYLSGVRYHAMPPMKRFRDMDQLSGGEKTMAALALLFCVATFAPPPFFVLDEVDAALDSQNVAKVAAYIRSRARPEFQFIVISLKASLYERAEGLVGVYRKTDDHQNSSASLTLDLEKYQ